MKKVHKEDIIATSFFICIWGLILILTGAYKSGYHFMDDHLITSYTIRFEKESFISVLQQRLLQDLEIRFRPLYWVEHLFLIKLFGDKWIFWGIHHFFVAILISFFIYKSARKLGVDLLISLGIVVIVLVGEQSEVFYRTSPAERSAMLFLSLGVYLRLYHKQHLLGVIFVTLATLFKESFILIVPFLLVGVYLIEYQSLSLENIRVFVSNYKYSILFFVTWVLVELSMIYLLLSEKDYIDAVTKFSRQKGFTYYLFGIEDKLNLKGVIMQIGLVLTDIKKLSYTALGVFLFAIITLSASKITRYSILLISVCFILLFLPQYLLYYKITFSLRYLLPVTAFYAILIGHFYKINTNQWGKYIQLFCLTYLSSYLILFTTNETVKYVKEGEKNRTFIEQSRGIVEERDSILVLIDPTYDYESSHAIQTYIDRETKGLDFKYFVIDKGGHSAKYLLNPKWLLEHKQDTISATEIYTFSKILAFNHGFGEGLLKEKNISLEGYEKKDFDTVSLFIKQE